MENATVVNYCFLGLLLLQGVLNVEGRSIFNPGSGNHVFDSKDDTDPQNKILALLLHKSLVPDEKDDPLGAELVIKLGELEELQVLKENLELEREITANLAGGKSINRKRGEPCFWKYCV